MYSDRIFIKLHYFLILILFGSLIACGGKTKTENKENSIKEENTEKNVEKEVTEENTDLDFFYSSWKLVEYSSPEAEKSEDPNLIGLLTGLEADKNSIYDFGTDNICKITSQHGDERKETWEINEDFTQLSFKNGYIKEPKIMEITEFSPEGITLTYDHIESGVTYPVKIILKPL